MAQEKWPAFEEVFHDFETRKFRAIADEDLETLMGETRIIRHLAKLKSARANAIAVCDIAKEAVSMGIWLTKWKSEQTVEL